MSVLVWSFSLHWGSLAFLAGPPIVRRTRQPDAPQKTAKGLPTFVSDESYNHRVEIEEEHQQVETQLDERLLLMDVELAEDLSRVKEMLVFKDPVE